MDLIAPDAHSPSHPPKARPTVGFRIGLPAACFLALLFAGCTVHVTHPTPHRHAQTGHAHAHSHGSPVRVVIPKGHVHTRRCGHYRHRGHWYHVRGHVHARHCGHVRRGAIWVRVR